MQVKMKEIRLNVFLIVIVCSIHLISAVNELSLDLKKAYCYQFRWVPLTDINKPEKLNCTGQKGIPCIEPLYTERPNLTELWTNSDENSLCSPISGDVCLKYTLSFSNSIVNQSFFCGKVIEDEVKIVESGCYEETKNGYTIEICACQSPRGTMPCNASMSINYSNFIIFILIIFFSYACQY